MKHFKGTQVVEAAIHVVAPREGRLVKTAAPLDLNDGVGDFLAEHVQRGLEDATASAANFVTRTAGRAGGICGSVLAGNTTLLDGSGALAERLYSATEEDRRIPDGTLAVATCTTDGGEDFLAMLKLDPSDQYSAVEGYDKNGLSVVRLVVRDDVLPSVRERIQKSVFVRASGGDYDALVVDRQRRGYEVSDYFVRDFLGAEIVFDDARRTKVLYRGLQASRNAVAAQLTEGQLARLDRYVDGVVVGAKVNVDDLVAGLPLPDESLRDTFRERVDRDLPDREFALDNDTAETIVRLRSYRGDHGLKVSHRNPSPDDLLEQIPPGTKRRIDVDGDRWTIVLRTRQWEQR